MSDDFCRLPQFARAISALGQERPRFSICSLVTRREEYMEMVESFVDHGFTPADCEYLYIDNSELNVFDAFSGYNLFLAEARGDYIILCHQDIVLLEDGRLELEARLAELEARDPNWGVCGNVGGIELGRVAIRISDPHGNDQAVGMFPVRVTALDENFMVARRAANLALSRDISGFHHYGADLCMVADFLGYNAWVLDFHLRHKSSGTADASYFQVRTSLLRKYQSALRPRWIVTSVSAYFVSSSRLAVIIYNSKLARLVWKSVQFARLRRSS